MHNDQRICEIEHAPFTPIVLSATGGLAHEATNVFKYLASLLSTKWDDEYWVLFIAIFWAFLSFTLHSLHSRCTFFH